MQALSIGRRLAASFSVLIVLVICITGLALSQLGLMARTVDDESNGAEQLRLSTEWLGQTRLNLFRTLTLAKASDVATAKADLTPQIKATSARISELQAALEATRLDDDERALYAAVGEARKTYVAERDQVFKAQEAGDVGLPTLIRERLQPSAEVYLQSIEKLSQRLSDNLARQADLAHAQTARTRQLLVGLGALAIALGALVAWQVTRSVTAPLHQLAEQAEQIASGVLSVPLTVNRRDELGELQQALEHMRGSLHAVVASIRQSTDGITTASSEIAAGSQDLSGRTEQAASNLQQTASSMSQLSTTVQATADSATTANQLAATAAETARRGGEVVGEVVGNMREISESSRRIADIIGVIDGIAFQTNILALNAAVEAARAGEQGRGFAVVAGEVRSLAGRSAEAAREIKGLIGASVDKVESGVRLVESAGTTMADIVCSVQRVSDIIGEITAATAEQSSGIGLINGTVTQLDSMTQQNAALVEQSAAAAESLKHQASRLAEVVQGFDLGDARSASSSRPAAPATPAPRRSSEAAAKPAGGAAFVHLGTQAPSPSSARPAAPPAAPVRAPAATAADGDWETF